MAQTNVGISTVLTRAASFAAYSIALLTTGDASLATALHKEYKGLRR